jgi:hypothetical protein
VPTALCAALNGPAGFHGTYPDPYSEYYQMELRQIRERLYPFTPAGD